MIRCQLTWKKDMSLIYKYIFHVFNSPSEDVASSVQRHSRGSSPVISVIHEASTAIVDQADPTGLN